MASSDEEESSHSDFEDDFDMESIRRACQITGTSPSKLRSQPPPSGNVSLSSDSDADDEDELALVRSIRERFAGSSAEDPLTLKPLRAKLPDWSDTDDGEDDDYEALRAIQQRFTANGGDLKGVDELLQRSVQVGATVIDSEKETSSSLFVERTNAREGFLNCVDKIEHSGQRSQASDDAGGLQPSNLDGLDEPETDEIAGSPLKRHLWPQSAHTVYDAIKMNRGCSEVIQKLMRKLESKMADLKKVIKEVKKPKKAALTSSSQYVKLISVPLIRANAKITEDNVHAIYRGPPENPHVANYKEALAAFPVSVSRVTWSKEEKENLLKGLKQQFQRTLLQHSVNLMSDADGSSSVSNDVDDIISSIKDLDITPERIRSFLPKVNWDQLASMYVPGRSGAECQTIFLNCEDPLINHGKWTSWEDKKLLHIVQQKGLHNWIDIAASLGTNRTPFQCLARYQRSLNASILKREWTKDEDNELRAAVETCGESNWQVVASAVEGRTGTQCSNRWGKTLNPERERVGKWTLEEDKRLKVAVALFGPKSWKKVANYVPGRTQVQCRERWVNCLDPSLNIAKWTEEEDSKLEAAIAQHGHCWTKVATCVPHRTDNQCWRRWKVLFPHEVPLFQEARKIQKTALITNFVDRESERPALGPNDFIAPDTFRITGSQNVDCSRSKNRRSRGVKATGKKGRVVENRRGKHVRGKSSKSHCAAKTKDGLDEEIRKSDVNDGNSQRRPRPQKRSRVRTQPISRATRSGKSITECCSKKHEDPDRAEESSAPSVFVDEEGLGRHALNSKKTSKLCSRRKSMKAPDTTDKGEMNGWDEPILKMKEAKKDKKKRVVATQDLRSPFPDSMSLLDIKKQLESVNGNKPNKKRKIQETCANSEDMTCTDRVQPTLEQPQIKLSNRDRRVRFIGDEFSADPNWHCQNEAVSAASVDFECSAISERHHNCSSQGNCLQHSVMASNGFRGDHSVSNELSNSEIEDDITLVSLLQQSGFSAPKVVKLPAELKKCTAQSRFQDSDVIITYSRRKRKAREDDGLKSGDDACPSPVVDAESADDTTLAHLCSNLKKRKKNS